jgi:hypothetical protein
MGTQIFTVNKIEDFDYFNHAGPNILPCQKRGERANGGAGSANMNSKATNKQ